MIITKQAIRMVKKGANWSAMEVYDSEVISKAEYDKFLANRMNGDRYYYDLTCLGRVPVAVHSRNPVNDNEKIVTKFSIELGD